MQIFQYSHIQNYYKCLNHPNDDNINGLPSQRASRAFRAFNSFEQPDANGWTWRVSFHLMRVSRPLSCLVNAVVIEAVAVIHAVTVIKAVAVVKTVTTYR